MKEIGERCEREEREIRERQTGRRKHGCEREKTISLLKETNAV